MTKFNIFLFNDLILQGKDLNEISNKMQMNPSNVWRNFKKYYPNHTLLEFRRKKLKEIFEKNKKAK